MHDSSFKLMQKFRRYVPKGATILDVGGADVNGTYKPIFADCNYKTLDWEKADYNVKGYNWNSIPKFDFIISGQMLEHDGYFWRTLENIKKITRKGVIIIVPSKGHYHAHPIDCYRFMPDCDKIFAELLSMKLIERVYNDKEFWGDLGMVFIK